MDADEPMFAPHSPADTSDEFVEPIFVGLNPEDLSGLVAEVPVTDSQVRAGVFWRGVWVQFDEFDSSAVIADAGSVAGVGNHPLTKLGRKELEDATPIAIERALSNLADTARKVVRASETTRRLAAGTSPLSIAISGVHPKWAVRGRFRSARTLTCRLAGRVSVLHPNAIHGLSARRGDLGHPVQPVLRDLDPITDRSIISHLGQAQEVQRIGGDHYDFDDLVQRMTQPHSGRYNYLVSSGGEDVGFAHIQIQETQGTAIAWLCLCIPNPALQFQGLGTTAFEELCSRALAMDATPTIELQGDEEAVRTIAERRGFALGGMGDNGNFFYQLPGGGSVEGVPGSG